MLLIALQNNLQRPVKLIQTYTTATFPPEPQFTASFGEEFE